MEMRHTTVGSYTGTREDVAGLVPDTATRILDVGCSDGSLGAGLRAQGAEVWGIEYDPGFAATAATRLDHVLEGDAAERLAEISESFDAVICADVLEHLVDPWSVLRRIRELLAPGGVCIVSLPNVRFYTTFLELGLRGRWPRRDRGVHDRTHLRWFTDADARSMFADTGFTVDAAITNYRLADRPSHRLNPHAKRFARGPLQGLLAYQHLYRVRAA
jgi:2-polyprenyl-3-methyl-5-hydroxy-6-metoxy-1,4-benzoquinol methylase